MADSTLSNLTSLTLPSQATDLLLVGRGTARPNKVAMSDALNSAALAATTAAYGVVLLAPNGGTTAGTVVQANDSRLTGGGGGVTSLAGTADQISVSAATGAVTLSLPSALILPGTLTVGTITAPSATNLTLNGGSSGASIVVGQGTNSNVTITPPGTGEVHIGTQMRIYPTVNAYGSFGGDVVLGTFSNHAVNFVQNGAEKARISTGANLLIGGTTDIAGSGGLKLFGSTDSSSTITGALQVVGGAGIAKALTLGGRLNAFGTAAALTHQLYVYNQLASATNAALSGAQFLAAPGYSTFVGTTGDGTNASYQGSIIGNVVQNQTGYVISDAAYGLLLHGINGGIKFAAGNPGTQYGTINNTGVWNISTSTNSTAYNSGALVVNGGVGIGGALFSQQNSNAIVTGTNFANTNAGTAATLRHTLTAGTNTSTIEAYSNGHATFPGRLRFGTPNGQMDFVPSGVLGMSVSASAVTVPTSLTVSGAGSAGTIWNTTNQGAGNVQTLLTLRESHNVDAAWPNSAARMLFAGRWNSAVDFEIADIRGFAGAGYQGGLVFGVHRFAPDTDPLVNAMFLSPAGNLVIGTTFSEAGLSGAGGLQVASRVAQGTEGIATGADPVFAASVTNATTKDILYWGAASRGGLLRGYHDGGGAIRWQFGRYSGGTFEEYLRLTGTTAASSVLTLYGGTQSVDNISGTLVVGGGIGLGGNINMGGRLFVNNTGIANDTLSASGIIANFGADATLGALSFGVKGYPSATGANRYVQITAADNATYREVRINDLGGNVTIGAASSQTTVGGTLTVASQVNLSNGPLQMSNGRQFQFQWNANTLTLRDNTAGNNPFTVNGSTSVFTVGYTTGAANTTSGALQVVGGVGVGGSIFAGGNITTVGAQIVADRTSSGNGVEIQGFTALIGTDATLGALGIGIGGLASATGSSRYGYIGAGDNAAWRTLYVGGRAGGGGKVLIPNTDISNSTSSGALVVSGGVGVAGAIYAGGEMVANAATNAFRIANSQTPASQTASGTQGQITWDASYLYVCTSTNNWGRSSLNWSGGGGGTAVDDENNILANQVFS